jgi:uncharacterized protein (TIGR03118 family)
MKQSRIGLGALCLAAGLAGCGGGGSEMSAAGHAYTVSALVVDTAATPGYGSTGARQVDARLVNAWGLAFNPAGFAWVANNGSATSTLYDGNGVPQALVVSTPAAPTGIVFNGSADFKVSQGGVSGASAFLFVGESGIVAGWAPGVDRSHALGAVDQSAAGAVYKGLALAQSGGANYLYAADFHNARIDVFDGAFQAARLSGGFVDPALPAGYAPFGIQAIGDRLYVAYAQQDAAAHDEVAGAGLGLVDVFDTGGNFLRRLISPGGALDAPWGIALAPADFGRFGGALLVGNFGDGRINAFDAASGVFLGTLATADGRPIVIDGLWGIAFGNGLDAQPTRSLFFTAGPGDEAHGAYGRIDVN